MLIHALLSIPSCYFRIIYTIPISYMYLTSTWMPSPSSVPPRGFVTANPGPDFPRAWTSRFQIELEGRVSHTAPTKFGLVKLDVQESFKRSLLQARLGRRELASKPFHIVIFG